MLASEVLDEAANRIEKYGWFKMVGMKKFYYAGKNKALTECAIVAINRITEKSISLGPLVQEKFAAYLDPKFIVPNSDFESIVVWNDAQPNKYNVIRKLRSVAKKLRAKGE